MRRLSELAAFAVNLRKIRRPPDARNTLAAAAIGAMRHQLRQFGQSRFAGPFLPRVTIRRSPFVIPHAIRSTRRDMLVAPFLALLPLALSAAAAGAGQIDPTKTAVTLPDAIKWSAWSGGPPHSGEVAALYGGLDEPGPYLVLMKWNPGYMSAPHCYATDRLSLVLSGTWWVNSGADFDPDNTLPVPAGGFVRRFANTPHYDGVKREAKEPTVIALFGIAPVKFRLVDPDRPAWRRV
jgi:hypothetical protein